MIKDNEMVELYVKSSLDDSLQPSLFYYCGQENRPLLVGLHTWSYDRFNQRDNLLPIAKENCWNLLLPDFRGPNTTENKNLFKACGSEYAVQDVFDAIFFVQKNYNIDKTKISVYGKSGGGQVALLVAAKNPLIFNNIAACVPVCDLSDWFYKNNHYAYLMEQGIGSRPDGKFKEEFIKRSPCYYYKELSKAHIKFFHGKQDSVVSYKQSLDLYLKIINYNPNAEIYLDIFHGGHQSQTLEVLSYIKNEFNKTENENVTG